MYLLGELFNYMSQGKTSSTTVPIDNSAVDPTQNTDKLPPRPADYDDYWYQADDGYWYNEYDDMGYEFAQEEEVLVVVGDDGAIIKPSDALNQPGADLSGSHQSFQKVQVQQQQSAQKVINPYSEIK